MKTTKWISIALAAALNLGGFLTTTSLGAEAAAPAHRGYLYRMAKRLHLTDDQKAQIKAVFQAEKGRLTHLRTRLRAARENLQSTIQAANANETSVRAASARVAAVEANLAVERMRIFGKIIPILTDDQRHELRALEQRANAFLDRANARADGPSGQ